MIIGIDPGSTESAYALYDPDAHQVIHAAKVSNDILITFCRRDAQFGIAKACAIEMPACYGMAVGKTVFDTCRWAGRFQEAEMLREVPVFLAYRKAQNKESGIDSVCMHLCKNNRAKDSNVRQALIDLFPATGGGKIPQIGIKSKPGPLFGMSKDKWSALAVAITFSNTYSKVDSL